MWRIHCEYLRMCLQGLTKQLVCSFITEITLHQEHGLPVTSPSSNTDINDIWKKWKWCQHFCQLSSEKLRVTCTAGTSPMITLPSELHSPTLDWSGHKLKSPARKVLGRTWSHLKTWSQIWSQTWSLLNLVKFNVFNVFIAAQEEFEAPEVDAPPKRARNHLAKPRRFEKQNSLSICRTAALESDKELSKQNSFLPYLFDLLILIILSLSFLSFSYLSLLCISTSDKGASSLLDPASGTWQLSSRQYHVCSFSFVFHSENFSMFFLIVLFYFFFCFHNCLLNVFSFPRALTAFSAWIVHCDIKRWPARGKCTHGQWQALRGCGRHRLKAHRLGHLDTNWWANWMAYTLKENQITCKHVITFYMLQNVTQNMPGL